MFANKQKKILSEGTQARAIVTNVQDTGMTINDNPRVKLTLQVSPEGAMPFKVTKRRPSPRSRFRESATRWWSATTRPTQPG